MRTDQDPGVNVRPVGQGNDVRGVTKRRQDYVSGQPVDVDD